MLEARQLTKSLATRHILTEASLTISPGRATVLIGPSGSGKTSMLRLLAGLDSPDSGSVLLDGQALSTVKPQQLWPRVTVVFQQLFLWPHLTLEQNLTLAYPESAQRPGSGETLGSICSKLGLTNLVTHYPNELSLGERQRAALARALLLNPQYLLLDEVTSALDVESSQNIVAILNSLKSSSEMGVLLVTHHLGLARRVGDDVVFLDEGVVVERGPVSILEDPTTARLQRFLSVA